MVIETLIEYGLILLIPVEFCSAIKNKVDPLLHPRQTWVELFEALLDFIKLISIRKEFVGSKHCFV